ncbi:hypothetical protein D3C87_1847620 [compost metagenome]
MNVIAGMTTLTTYRPAIGRFMRYGVLPAGKRYFTFGEMIFHSLEIQRTSR